MPITDVLTDMIFPPLTDSGGAQATKAITPTASPYVFKATIRCAVYVSGGTITTATYGRGSSSFALGVLSAGQLFELNAGDTLTLAYATAPTITLIPR